MVRSSQICSNLKNILDRESSKISLINYMPKEIVPYLKNDRNAGLTSYISEISVDDINYDYLLKLDSIRSYIKYGSNKIDKDQLKIY